VILPSAAWVAPVPSRPLVTLNLLVDQMTPSTVWLVFKTPTAIGPFKRTASRSLGVRVSSKATTAVEVIEIPIADPELLALAWQEAGGQVERDPSRAIEEITPLATPEDAERVRVGMIAAARRGARVQILTFMTAAGITGARFSLSNWPVSTGVRIGLGCLAVAWLVALLVLLLPVRPERRKRARARWIAVAVLALVCLALVVGLSASAGGATLLVGVSLGVGVACGVPTGLALRQLRGLRPAKPPASALGARTPTWGTMGAAGSVLLAIVLLGTLARLEERAAADLHLARAAAVEQAALETHWVRSAAFLNRGNLDQHICGSDDAVLPAHTASFERQFKREKSDRAFLDGAASVQIVIARDEEAAREEFAAVRLPGYLDCAREVADREIGRWMKGRLAPVESMLVETASVEGVDDGIRSLFHAEVKLPGGHRNAWLTLVRLRQGRVIVRMPIIEFGVVQHPKVVDDVIEAEIEALRAADP
ncbi:MAG: hypothetical protein ACT4OV_01560, partial [Microthrixaceae bacterium]